MDISEQTGLKKETITLLMDLDAEMIERVINSFLNDEGYVLEEPFINELKMSIELRDVLKELKNELNCCCAEK
ncbi:hypothetical protein AT268_31930 [Bacillus cereus]|uniref:Uncharacterized protein n=1 Tax=Bacillus cereus TaxID=1396 RepID=A0A9X0MJX2_BACCE|nr:hypothetical protein [Bacillus cereus]KXY51113.1 hypothetical protein AT268_31930 [Bacillus cereus]